MVTKFDDGSSHTIYENGRESYTDPSGFSVEIVVDQNSGTPY